MNDPWASSTEQGQRKADGVAEAVNATLGMLLDRCHLDEYEVRHYYDIIAIGYGEQVRSALPAQLGGKLVVSTPELFQAKRLKDPTDPFSGDWWIDPEAANGTPMDEAMNLAGGLIRKWAEQHPESFPPVVINISDGMPNEGQEADTLEWSRRIQSLQTQDGNVLVFNVHISGAGGGQLLYPGDRSALPDDNARLLFDMSSPLPEFMRRHLEANGKSVANGSRAFVYNAKPADLILALMTGTVANNGNNVDRMR